MGRAQGNTTGTERFEAVLGQRRGAERPELAPELPRSLGGAPGGMLVRLDSVDTTRVIKAVKALRAATDSSLKWAKADIYDRVARGEPAVVSIRVDAELSDLTEGGWKACVASDDGAVNVTLRISAGDLNDLRRFVKERGGALLRN